jgi:hypothetical protein
VPALDEIAIDCSTRTYRDVEKIAIESATHPRPMKIDEAAN